jgi:hypothetical protein
MRNRKLEGMSIFKHFSGLTAPADQDHNSSKDKDNQSVYFPIATDLLQNTPTSQTTSFLASTNTEVFR